MTDANGTDTEKTEFTEGAEIAPEASADAKPTRQSRSKARSEAEDEDAEQISVADAIGHSADMTALAHVPVDVQVVLGRTRLPIGQILKLGRGAVVEIDRKVGEQVEIHLNHRPVARGEIVIVDDDRLGVTITEIINPQSNLH